MSLRHDLLRLSEAFAEARGLKLSRVSTLLFNDGKRLGQIATGKDLYTARFEAAVAWLDANWPADLVWPADVPRPSTPSPPPLPPGAVTASAARLQPAAEALSSPAAPAGGAPSPRPSPASGRGSRSGEGGAA